MVVDVAVLRAGPPGAPARSGRRDRIFVLERPGRQIELVNVLLDVEIAREPGEVIPVAHLPFHVGPLGFAGLDPDRSAQIVELNGFDVADGAVVNALHDLAVSERVPVTKARYHGQSFLLGRLT